ncbi:MAG: hypothetical protein H8E85_07855 [Candidatus Marinimicrobia bacterium]|nr:hypothetical protein [Candidatus Neomarinimicrobiota bacterium]
MNILFTIILGFTLLQADGGKNINFRYGFIGQVQSNPDSTVELGDKSIVHTNDEIRVNIGYILNSHFYLIYLDSDGIYSLILPEVSIDENSPDTLYTTILRGGLTNPVGNETFYLLNSNEPLSELIKLLSRYESAPKKGKIKLAKRIQTHLDDLDPNVKADLSSIASRLDKPLVGGVAFRGDDDDELKEMSLTHECKGSGGIAFQKIVLIHK